MSIKLYNSLSRRLEDFKPLKKGQVSIYTCGPTVYDHITIGNLRTYIFEDTLRRVLKLNGYKLKHAMNLTDIDDKTIKRSQQKYPELEARQALHKLTQHYEQVFLDDAKRLGIDFSETKVARATEHIEDMHKLIKAIPNKYVAEDGVYFDISEYKDYGVLVNLDRSHEHHRINNDEYDKEHLADFALWKAQKPGEPAWDFELEGRQVAGHPGWHIECSAMSAKYLGQPFDIHTGGVDLKFPHHENEIAQSRAATNHELAKVWVHGEHLLVDGKKMSKSLKNFYTLEDIEKKGYDPLAFRLLVLQAHYRSQLNFTWESLEAAQSHLNDLRAMADAQFQPQAANSKTKVADHIEVVKMTIETWLNNDLNTAAALGALGAIDDIVEMHGISKAEVPKFVSFLKYLDQVFGLDLSARQDIPKAQRQLINEREEARLTKDYAKADALRKQLEKAGIGLNDTDHGAVWYRL